MEFGELGLSFFYLDDDDDGNGGIEFPNDAAPRNAAIQTSAQ